MVDIKGVLLPCSKHDTKTTITKPQSHTCQTETTTITMILGSTLPSIALLLGCLALSQAESGPCLNGAYSVLYAALGNTCIESVAAPTVVYSAAPTPSAVYDPDDCSVNVEGCARAANVATEVCYFGVYDCDSYCKEVIPEAPYGRYSTCDANVEYPGGGATYGVCSCGAVSEGVSDFVGDALVAAAEVTCWAWDVGLALGEDFFQAFGILTGSPEFKWVGRVLKFGNEYFAHGSKIGDCPNSICPDHNFVKVDPEHLSEMLGWLDPCGDDTY
jgi:hypothetical protein